MRRERRPLPLAGRILADSCLLLLIVVWWAAAQHVSPYILPSPAAVGASLLDLALDLGFAGHVGISAFRILIAMAVSLVFGTALAFTPYYLPSLTSTVNARIRPFLNSFPAIGWALLATIWFKVSDFTVIFVQVAILTPFCLINLGEGVRRLDRELLEMGASFSKSRWRVFFRIALPLMAPYFLATLRISYGVAWKIALVAELFGARSGIGFAMLQAQTLSDVPTVLAISLVIVLLFVIGDRWVIDPLARRYEGVSA